MTLSEQEEIKVLVDQDVVDAFMRGKMVEEGMVDLGLAIQMALRQYGEEHGN